LTGVSYKPGQTPFLWQNLRDTGYAINTEWEGWARLEALERAGAAGQLIASSGVLASSEVTTTVDSTAEEPDGPAGADGAAGPDGQVGVAPEAQSSVAAEGGERLDEPAADVSRGSAEAEPATEAGQPEHAVALGAAARRARPWRRTLLLGIGGLIAVGLIGLALVLFRQSASWTVPDGGYSVTIAPAVTAAPTGMFIPLVGITSGLPPATRMWVVVSFGGYSWPQERALRAGNIWSGYARIGNSSADSGKLLDVLAVLVDPATDGDFSAWLGRGSRTGQYPPYSVLPMAARVAAKTTVRVK